MNKYEKLHALCQASSDTFKKLGIHDGFIGIDSEYYIDLNKLKNTNEPLFKDSYAKIQSYFDTCVACIQESNMPEARALLHFQEAKEIALGVSFNTYCGRGLTGATAHKFAESIETLYKNALDLSGEDILAIAPMCIENIGVDRSSDMAAQIIKDDIISYTNDAMAKIGVKNLVRIKGNNGATHEIFTLYRDDQKKIPVLLLPTSILSSSPNTINVSDVEYSVASNEECRRNLEKLSIDSVNRLIREMKKGDRFHAFVQYRLFPKMFESFHSRVRSLPAQKYEETSENIFLHDDGLMNLVVDLIKKYAEATDSDSGFIDKVLKSFKTVLESDALSDTAKSQINERTMKVFFVTLLNGMHGTEICKLGIPSDNKIIYVKMDEVKVYLEIKTAKRTRHLNSYDSLAKVVASNPGSVGFYVVLNDNDADIYSRITKDKGPASGVKYREISTKPLKQLPSDNSSVKE